MVFREGTWLKTGILCDRLHGTGATVSRGRGSTNGRYELGINGGRSAASKAIAKPDTTGDSR